MGSAISGKEDTARAEDIHGNHHNIVRVANLIWQWISLPSLLIEGEIKCPNGRRINSKRLL